MFERYLHDFDPILGRVGGLYFWWYGLGYSLGFLETFLFLRRHRDRLALTPRETSDRDYGIDSNNSRVCSWRGFLNKSTRDWSSTSLPRCMTATRSATCSTTLRSWAMKR